MFREGVRKDASQRSDTRFYFGVCYTAMAPYISLRCFFLLLCFLKWPWKKGSGTASLFPSSSSSRIPIQNTESGRHIFKKKKEEKPNSIVYLGVIKLLYIYLIHDDKALGVILTSFYILFSQQTNTKWINVRKCQVYIPSECAYVKYILQIKRTQAVMHLWSIKAACARFRYQSFTLK